MTETFILGLVESRPRLRLLFWVSWNQDQNRDFHFGSCGIKTETETFILSLVRLRLRPTLFLKSHGTKDKVKNTLYFCEHKQINVLIQKNQFVNERTQVIIIFFILPHKNHNCQYPTLSLDHLDPPPPPLLFQPLPPQSSL